MPPTTRKCNSAHPQAVAGRVHKVTLRVSQPSAPAPPNTTPVSPPPPLPPLPPLPVPSDIDHLVPQTPLLPPQSPHLPAHPYGGMFGPPRPVYPPVSHYPYGASIGTAPPPPWGYTQYPMVPSPLAYPLAQHAAAGDEYLPAHGDMQVAVTSGSASTNNATPLPTAGAQPGRSYPNREVSPGGMCHLQSHKEADF